MFASSVLKQPETFVLGLLPVPMFQAPTCEGLRWKRKRCSKEIVAPGRKTSAVVSLIVAYSRVKFCLSYLALP